MKSCLRSITKTNFIYYIEKASNFVEQATAFTVIKYPYIHYFYQNNMEILQPNNTPLNAMNDTIFQNTIECFTTQRQTIFDLTNPNTMGRFFHYIVFNENISDTRKELILFQLARILNENQFFIDIEDIEDISMNNNTIHAIEKYKFKYIQIQTNCQYMIDKIQEMSHIEQLHDMAYFTAAFSH
ncbi:MAG: hypothetical protein V4629_02205 [Pseudomonadota bacterium]